MNPPERWKQIKDVLYAALEIDPAERSSFLDERCADDPELRREVDSLLSAHASAERLESPAVEMIAEAVSTSTERTIGDSLAHYAVIEKLGEGGMGEVYLAEDTLLGRKVALKLLPQYFTLDRERVRRFQQEARAASALNHPNIITIYEIREVDSRHYIATEFIDGETLRDRIIRDPWKISDALDIAVQVAGALSAAHEAGIIHRDIKPENIMLRRDRIAKVLDFGLAKLTEKNSKDVEASTMVRTDDGIVMGTVQYMSPEQARGLKVDARSDIWSLGCVLYEMLTGRAPFTGPTPGDVIVSILEREPPPLGTIADELSPELRRIVMKALAKDRERRYQTVKDLLIDLKNLCDDLEFEAKLDRSQQPGRSSGKKTETYAVTDDTHEPGNRTTERFEVADGMGGTPLPVVTKRRPAHLVASAGAILVATLVGGYWAFSNYGRAPTQAPPSEPSQAMRIIRLTTTGKASRAAISPDGRYAVHVAVENGQQSLRVRQVNTRSEVQVVPPSEVQYTGLTFSRDGDFIFYVVSDRNRSNLFQVAALGGPARQLTSDVVGAVTFSPDGRQLAFIRDFVEQGEQGLMIANSDGSGERKIASRKFPNFFASVSWSPDGKTIACGAGTNVPVFSTYVIEVPAEGGPERQVQSPGWKSIGQIGWLHDGSGLILEAAAQDSAGLATSQIWLLPREGGTARRITNDLNNYSGVSLTADSGRLVTVQSETVSNVWLMSEGQESRAVQVTHGSGKRDGKDGAAWTPDGRVVYVSNESGSDDVWIMNPDGSGKEQLTSGAGVNSNPAVSPDGRFIVFTSTRDGAPHLWRIDLNGANAKQLTSGGGENHGQFTADGRWVVYTLYAGKPTLWRVSIDGGAPLPITDRSVVGSAVSPDGNTVAAVYRGISANSPARVAIISIDGGDILREFDIAGPMGGNIRFTPDGNAIAYLVTIGGVSNIWLQPLEGGTPKQLTNFSSEQIFSFDWSRDGKRIVCSRGTETNDAVLLSNFR